VGQRSFTTLYAAQQNCHDLEDVDHHYKIIKCSKTSSDSEVNERFKEKWSANKAEVLRYHPDKVTADRGKYAAATSFRDKLQAAKEVLCKKDENGCNANRIPAKK
jgi:curved DNA-binding protein CbpA